MHLILLWSQIQAVAPSQPLLPSCQSLMLHLDTQAGGDLGTGVPLSTAGSHSGPLAQPGLIDKLISEHPAARRDAFNQRPPCQPPPLQSKFFLWPTPSGKAGDGKPADFSSVVCKGLCPLPTKKRCQRGNNKILYSCASCDFSQCLVCSIPFYPHSDRSVDRLHACWKPVSLS